MVEDVAWEGPKWLYAFLLGVCALLVYGQSVLASKSKPTEKYFWHYPPAFVEFQRRFLGVFFLFTLTEGLQTVYREALYEHYGFGRRDIGIFVVTVHVSALIIGTFLGAAADCIGRRKASIICGLLQLVGCLVRYSQNFYLLCVANVCHGLAISLFPTVLEAWLNSEHERLGFRQEWLCRTFWVMALGTGTAAIGVGAFANLIVDRFGLGLVSPTFVAAAIAGLCILLVLNGWVENVGTQQPKLSVSLFNACQALKDKRILLLGWIQTTFDVTFAAFQFLWTPTLIADGRDIHSGMIYAYLMASLMLGSAVAAFLLCGPYTTRPENFLPHVFVVASLALLVPAYDHQEIGVLVTVFCIYHVCVGIAWPSLAYLRSIYISNDRRAGVLSFYRVPVHLGMLFILIKGGILKHVENSSVFYLCILGLLSGCVALHSLDKYRHQTSVGVKLQLECKHQSPIVATEQRELHIDTVKKSGKLGEAHGEEGFS
ncbi:hypothetical protein R1flu_016452 [Riccia fluitans]|uniref:Uncharacterized protein n=1 Tax=Riccia fluitans TaxID=41844 RepID=A0ABD1YLX1_9MARC